MNRSRARLAPTASVGSANSPCASEQGWGTGPEVGSAAMSPAPLYLTRVGQHVWHDRVVFDFNGPEAVGFVVRYVPIVRTDGSGEPVWSGTPCSRSWSGHRVWMSGERAYQHVVLDIAH
jgi:hypothetical protein